MYTVLKTKRYHFEIPSKQDSAKQNKNQNNQEARIINEMIVGSCFLDDVFILFLFNTGKYLIVNSSSNPNQLKKKQLTNQSQIVYRGNVLTEISKQKALQLQEEGQLQDFQSPKSPKKLISKNSLTYIEQSYLKIIFTDCRRIKINQCIIITRHSKNVYWLKLSKKTSEQTNYTAGSIKTDIIQLPRTMVSNILSSDHVNFGNMTVLTEILQFNNSQEGRGLKDLSNKKQKTKINKQAGSFCIKNQIIEDKMIYLTIYTRIPSLSYQKQPQTFPYYIITKMQYPIPINQTINNFIIEVSDKQNNELAIYKQQEDDQNEWKIQLYGFNFQDLSGEELIRQFLDQYQKEKQKSTNNEEDNSKNTTIDKSNSRIAIYNLNHIPKPKVIILPNQFTSSIHIQQIIRYNNQYDTSLQKTYMIVSINQVFNHQEDLLEKQLEENDIVDITNSNENNPITNNQNQYTTNQMIYRINGQIVRYQNGQLIQNNNIHNKLKIKSYCWVHSLKLIFQNKQSSQYRQSIQKLSYFKFDPITFLKIINVSEDYQLLYVLSLAHQRVDGQLYQNKIDLIDKKTGRIVEKGYCSLKNYSFSANQKLILDVPYTFTQRQDFFYHIRLLFDKKSLYVYLLENAKQYFEQYQNVNFIQTVLSLL